jgi:ABC-type multidrug transport system fused ATPase/permease subunit
MLCLSSIVAASALTLLEPLIIKWLIDVALARRNMRSLLIGTTAFGVAYVCQLAFSYAAYVTGFVVTQRMIFRIRVALLRRLHLLSARFYDNQHVGEILYKVEQDVDRVGELGGDTLPTLVRMTVVGVMVLITMGVLNLRLTVTVLPLLPLLYMLQRRFMRYLSVAAANVQEQMGCISALLQEHLVGILQLQLLNRSSSHSRKCVRSLALGARIQTMQKLAEVRFSAVSMLVIIMGGILILGYGGSDVIRNRLSIGGLVAFYSYVNRLFEPMSLAVDLQSRLQRVRASIRRIVGILSDEDITNHRAKPCTRLTREGSIELEFTEVCFSYRHDQTVLDRLSLRLGKGEKIALVGISGCGKSTVGYLATRLYDPDSGSVLINGTDLRNLGHRNLRSLVTVVPQEPVLFSATMRENVLYGDPSAADRDLDRALSLARLHDVIRKLPRGLDEPLGPMGRKLSGGEKKRVALARAFLQQPKILILDEVTSGLDGPTVASLLEGLDVFRKGRSLIVITHNPSAISWSDRIAILEQGKILDHGKHRELMDRCELYRMLYEGLLPRASKRVESSAFEP